jgi:thioredoxin 1
VDQILWKEKAMSDVAKVTAENFQSEVLESPIPVLVDLYADWCMPCRAMGRVLSRLAPTLAGQVKMVKVNVDEEAELAAAFGVSSIPMLVLFRAGKAVTYALGAQPAEAVLRMIEKVEPAAAPPAPAQT